MLELTRLTGREASDGGAHPPILISLLGGFRVDKTGDRVPLRHGGKPENFLCSLALRLKEGMRRDHLLVSLWPDRDALQATQSLNTLVHALQKLLGDALDGGTLVLRREGRYWLNTEAGIWVDVARFEALADVGEGYRQAGREDAALEACCRAVQLYSGDLCDGGDTYAAVERERLRERYLNLLTLLADSAYKTGDYATSLSHTKRLLVTDPCREDAHRRAMRCYVRLGERGQALRQFRLCETLLRDEFGAVPEPVTRTLFDQIRLDPAAI